MRKVKTYVMVCWISSCLLLSPDLICQDYASTKFDRLSSENFKLEKGISQNWIYSIMQDKDGYIWFGTWDGLNKYDGYNFTIYNVADGLSDHTIYSMVEDHTGKIWLGTDKGLNRYDRATNTFKQFNLITSDSSGRYANRVNYLMLSRDSALWLGTGSGLKRFDPETEVFTDYLSAPQEYFSPRSNYILHLFEDDRGILWLSTTYGLVKFDPHTKRSTRYYSMQGDSTGLSHDNIRCVIQERSGNFWIGTRHGLNYFDTLTQKIRQYFHDPNDGYSLGGNWVRTILEDRAGNIWLGTDGGGLSRYDRSNDRFIRFNNNIDEGGSLSNDRVYSIFEDLAGNLWVGTYNGVNKINKYANNFKHVKQSSEPGIGTNSNFIWDFFEDKDDRLWIGTSNGVNIYDQAADRFEYIIHDPADPHSLMANEVRTMTYIPELNCVFMGLYGTGLDRLNIDTREIRHYVPSPDKNSLSDVYISDLLYDDHYLWIATSLGLDRFDPKTNKFVHYEHHPGDSSSLSNDIVVSLFVDSGNNLWVGTDKGLNKFNRQDETSVRYFHGTENTLLANTFFFINEDKTGKLWLGTSGNGLVKFDPATGDYTVFTKENGLPNNIVYGVLEHSDGNLWMSTNMGLAKFFVVSEHFISYDVKDGIQSFEFNLGSAYRGRNGLLYFGGMNGYNVFDPGEIHTNPNKPVIVISAFRKFNELQPHELKSGDTIRLTHDDNFFSFEISALDYTNPGNNKYRYFLEGFDKNWTTVDAGNRVAEYKKVRPGSYTFYATGSNNDGIWNESGIAVEIIIHPPWYGTWWFRILLGLTLVSMGWLIIYRRLKQIRTKNEVERKVLEIEKQKFDLEQKALRLQMNPHFIFNSLNSIQSYIVTHDTEMAVTYLGKFSQLMRLILTNSGNKYVVFKEELKAIRHYLDLEKLRFDKKFDYKIKVDKRIDTEFIEIPPMIVQPYIENAIIHGILHKPTQGQIDIDFKLNGQQILCTVTDNGVGREKAAEFREKAGIKRKSSGMYITKARLDLLNQQGNEDYSVKIIDLKDEKGASTGTRVDLVIQYNED